MVLGTFFLSSREVLTGLKPNRSLNGLTVANRIHLLEPQWNPAVEKQAIGRVLRLDQREKVTVIRYAVEKTIEEVRISRLRTGTSG